MFSDDNPDAVPVLQDAQLLQLFGLLQRVGIEVLGTPGARLKAGENDRSISIENLTISGQARYNDA